MVVLGRRRPSQKGAPSRRPQAGAGATRSTYRSTPRAASSLRPRAARVSAPALLPACSAANPSQPLRPRTRTVVPFQDLREFVAPLEKRGQLRRITASGRRELESTETADRAVKGPRHDNVALLFERVEGFSMPLLINTFGTE